MTQYSSLVIPIVAGMVWTAPMFSAEMLTQADAQRALFPAATAFNAQTLKLDSQQRTMIRELSGVAQRGETQNVWQVKQGEKNLGWFVVDEVIGKHEFITYAVGLSTTGEVVGVEILIYRETHGGQVREKDWRKNFVGKKIDHKFKLDDDIPNITGATLSCRNVCNGVKRVLAIQKVALGDG